MGIAIASMLGCWNALWFGWSGRVTEEAERVLTPSIRHADGATLATIDLSPNEHRDFYLGYSNSVVWPVFHSRLDLAQFDAGYFVRYRRVNTRFATLLAKLLRPDDTIWVHDYQFLLLGEELRALGSTHAIGFFLHIPVPPAQMFLTIPEHRELAKGLSTYNLIGVQTRADVRNLIDFMVPAGYGRLVADGRVRIFDREVSIGSFPVGVDVSNLHGSAPPRDPHTWAPHRILGVDRLDYTKGLPCKFRAFGKLLQWFPEYRGRVVLSQIAAPSRERVEAYADIRAELESLAGNINGRFGELDWTPIHYIRRTIRRAALVDIYRSSRVCAVTPLRDGMNLVAKEYVASQDGADPGVLVLSRFAGAADELQDAILVNPYDIDGMARALRLALQMSRAERQRRHEKLFKSVRENDAATWARSFIGALQNISWQVNQPLTEIRSSPVALTKPSSLPPGRAARPAAPSLRSLARAASASSIPRPPTQKDVHKAWLPNES